MPLFARSFQDLTVDSVESLADTTNITRLSPGAKARALLEASNKRLEEAYDIFDLNLARAFVSAATGQFLDLIGSLLSVERKVAESASVTSSMEVLKLYVDSGTLGDVNNGADFIFPVGELISTEVNNAGVIYRTTTNSIVSASASTVYVSAEASVPGDESNLGTGVLVHHSFTNYADYTNETLKVTNVHPIANGKSFESDDNYRYRIVNRVLEAEAANITAIRLAALSTSGVADVIITPRYRGIGTVGIIVKSVTPTVSNSLIEAIEANVFKVQALGDIIYVRGPKESGLTIRATIHYSQKLTNDELDEIESLLDDVITAYVNELDIGETFVLNRMVSELFAIDDNIANIGEPGDPIEELYIYKESRLDDNKVRQKLLGDYYPVDDERVIIEPSVINPIVFERAYIRR